MIENAKQRRVTAKQLALLENALRTLKQGVPIPGREQLFDLYSTGIQSMIDELAQSIKDYDSKRRGT